MKNSLTQHRKTFSGEYALVVALLLDSLGVELQVKSGLGISCISSVSYVLSQIFTGLSFGTWNYLVQIFVLALLVVVTRQWKLGYLVSLVLSVAFGSLLDVFAAVLTAPVTLVGQAVCYAVGFCVTCFSMWMLQRCLMPIMPFDTFNRDMTSFFHWNYRTFNTCFNVICLSLSVSLALVFTGHIVGIGPGTVVSALCTGTLVSAIGGVMDREVAFQIKYRPMWVFA
ncbi:MAG: DUF6198 family protein [Clostridiales bacterium]|nr:DUF6198 family protein [Clostridiales bacterium]